VRRGRHDVVAACADDQQRAVYFCRYDAWSYLSCSSQRTGNQRVMRLRHVGHAVEGRDEHQLRHGRFDAT
jgi:hypothetical protein